jgi:hypothetical protein
MTSRSQEFWAQYTKAHEGQDLAPGFDPATAGAPDVIYSPTATSNPSDPRTSGFSYWKDHRTLVARWGDGGTPYYYSDVDPSEFRRLTRSKSPGRFINRVLNSKPYGPIASSV